MHFSILPPILGFLQKLEARTLSLVKQVPHNNNNKYQKNKKEEGEHQLANP